MVLMIPMFFGSSLSCWAMMISAKDETLFTDLSRIRKTKSRSVTLDAAAESGIQDTKFNKLDYYCRPRT